VHLHKSLDDSCLNLVLIVSFKLSKVLKQTSISPQENSKMNNNLDVPKQLQPYIIKIDNSKLIVYGGNSFFFKILRKNNPKPSMRI
jgi:hypothetical protein